MAALDTRSDRILWGVGNLAAGALCIPFCYGLSADFTSFKFLSAALGVGAGLNSVRLFHEHEQGAGVRSAYRVAGEMVSGAWIESMAMQLSPPSFQAPIYQPARDEFATEYLPTPPQFQMSAPPPPEDLPDRGDSRQYGKMPGLSRYSAVLAYGIPGAGKTTFVEEEVGKRLELGHEVIVLDPHAAYGQWRNCEIVGGGMNYTAIDAKMIWFEKEIERRYKLRETQLNPKFEPLTIVAEEFTNWATRCKNSGEHFKTVNSDIRKVECYSIIVTHTRTLAGLGDAKGMASLRDESMLEVEILGDYNPVTERATPRFEALVKMPGQALSDRTLVKLDRHSGKLPQQQPEVSDTLPKSFLEASQSKPEKPGSLDGMGVSGLEAILSQILESGGSATVYGTEWGLSDTEKFELAKLVVECESGKEKRILCLWGAKSGGRTHQKYVEACGYLDRLIQQINNNV